MKKLDMMNMVFGLTLARDLEQQERMMTALGASQLPAGDPLGVIFLRPLIDGRVEADAKIAKLNADLDRVKKQLPEPSANGAGEPVSPPQDEATLQDLQHQLAVLRESLTVDLSAFAGDQPTIGLTVALPTIEGVNVSVNWTSDGRAVDLDITPPDQPETKATLKKMPDEAVDWSATFEATFRINDLEVIKRAVTISATGSIIKTIAIDAPVSREQDIKETARHLVQNIDHFVGLLNQ